jgi:hypothetical protein
VVARRSPDRSRGLPDDEGSYAAHLEDLDVPDATFACSDLTTFCRLDELGLEVVGQRLEPDRAVLACRVVEPDAWCRRCGCEGAPRDTLIRRLAHEPLGWRPTTLEVTIRRYRSRRGLRRALEGIVCQHLTVARVAEGLGVAWNTANDAVLAEGKRVLIEDPARFEGVKVLGVDEHVWRHTRRGDKYVTVIIDLTPIREGSGPARLLDMVQGRSKQAFKQWLADRPQAWRDKVQVVAMDGFTGFKTATSTRAWEAPFGRPPTSAATSSTPRGASTSSSGDSCEQFVGGRGGDGDPGRL